jgi:asparagine synthase (glutamine-hydrolysing)
MCGIAGVAGWDGSPAAVAESLRVMCDAIRHRGPDDAGYHVQPDVALGMRRLSIIDLASGHQPIGNEDDRIQIVFNGEVYNYRELRESLVRDGHRFRTHTDTETILHLYEERGDRVVDSLRGMFAFAIWDGRRERLLLARDRLGIKPLYYWERDGGLAFASERKSLRRLEGFPTEIDLGAMGDYLSLGYVPEPASIHRGVRKLPPGHLLVWERGKGAREERYWSPERGIDESISEAEAVEEIRRLLAEAVRYRLIADVPLGAFLSGGIDSTAVVAEMTRQMDRPVRTFSIGFSEPEFNEAPHAAAVAKALGTEHTELIVRPDVEALIEEVALAFDEPFADSSAIPTLLVSRLARRQVKVVLSGDGGDEIFGGYTRYLDLARRNVPIPAAARGLLGAVARRLPPSTPGRNRLLELSRTLQGRYAGMVAYPLRTDEGGVALPHVVAAAGGMDELLAPWFARAAGRDPLAQAALVDLLSYLPGDILTKVDRMSMAASLEARVPLLDHRMVELAVTLPSRMKFRGGVGKWIFREALRGLVPESVFEKPKQGFGVPLRPWFRDELSPLVEELLRPSAGIYEFVDPRAVRQLVGEHRTGRRDHSAMIWRLLVLHLWRGGSGRPAARGALESGAAPRAVRVHG